MQSVKTISDNIRCVTDTIQKSKMIHKKRILVEFARILFCLCPGITLGSVHLLKVANDTPDRRPLQPPP